MEKIITAITTQLLSKLSKERITYTQKELSDFGFPQFLIKRITFHLVRELNKEFKLPGEEWLNLESDELLSEWAELQRTIRSEIHLPAFLAEQIVEKSVRECLGMTIHPYKVIPELLFEDQVELDSNQLTERSSAITVNRFLVWSMVRYMEKKNRISLNISDASRIIESIENKIIENYHPLNWLSLVKPLYELSGSTFHSDLFRRFFEHKGKNHLAKEFDLIDAEIKESRFIEILSSPNSIHVDGYVDDQQTLFREKQEAVNKDDSESEDSKDFLPVNQDEMIEDLTDDTPIFQTFREDPLQEPDEWVGDEEEEIESTQERETEKEQISLSDEKNEVDDLQDKDLIAPWEEDEEDAFTFITHEETEDSPEPGLNDLFQEDEVEVEGDDEGDDEGEKVVFEEEIEHTKKEDSATDAALLEIDDEDEIDDKEEIEDEGENDDEEEIDDEHDIDDEEDKDAEVDSEKSDRSVILNLNMGSKSVDDSDEEDSSLINRFMFDDSDNADAIADVETDKSKKVSTIYDELNLVRSDSEPKTLDLFGTLKSTETEEQSLPLDSDDKSSDVINEESETIQKFSDLAGPEIEEDSDDAEVPMWRSFLERDENDIKSAFQFDDKSEDDDEEDMDEEDSDETLDEDGFIEEPIYDFTQKEPDLNEKIGDLSNWMKDVREKFIEDLFGDSEDAYEQALSDIMEFDDWKNASKYIEKEIFTRNRIDVYDEIAVDFTDRLHSYFIENKS